MSSFSNMYVCKHALVRTYICTYLYFYIYISYHICTCTQEAPSEGEYEGPIREAKWWYSTFHTVTAMVGAGVLSLPYAMAYLGWYIINVFKTRLDFNIFSFLQNLVSVYFRGPGMAVMVISWCMTLHTMWLLVQLHELTPGTRFDRYIDLAKYTFGSRLGPWIVLPQQLIVQVGVNIVYMVTGGTCLQKFVEMVCTDCTRLRHSYWIIIFGSTHFLLSQLPNFNSVYGVSLAAASMSLW